MIVRRKFNLDRIKNSLTKTYENLDIEVEGNTLEECARKIDESWRAYSCMIAEGKIE